jgi:hypothetical protein
MIFLKPGYIQGAIHTALAIPCQIKVVGLLAQVLYECFFDIYSSGLWNFQQRPPAASLGMEG